MALIYAPTDIAGIGNYLSPTRVVVSSKREKLLRANRAIVNTENWSSSSGR